MPSLLELREQASKKAQEIYALREKMDVDEPSAEDTQAWERVNKDYDTLGARIRRAQREEEIAKHLESPAPESLRHADDIIHRETGARPGPTDGPPDELTRMMAMSAWFQHHSGRSELMPSDEQYEAMKRCRINPNARELSIPLLDNDVHRSLMARVRPLHPSLREKYIADYFSRAQGTTTIAAGGALVPVGFIRNFEIALLAFGGMLEVADVMTTATGERLPWPNMDDTANQGRYTAENAEHTAATDLAMGQLWLDAYMVDSGILKVSTKLLRDAAFDVNAIIAEAAATRIARFLNAEYTNGTGAGKIAGVIPQSTLGVTTASATAIAYGEPIKLMHSVDPAYRSPAFGFGFMCHDDIVLSLRQLVSTTGEPLWADGLRGGNTDMLLGFPLTVNQSMTGHTAGALVASTKTLLAGAMKKYKIRRAGALRLKISDQRYFEYDQVAYMGIIETDGNLLDAGTHPVKHMIQHA